MDISERLAGGATIVDLHGRLTIDNSVQLLKEKIESLVSQGRKQIVINLGDVPYIDSGGLGMLVACHTTLIKAGGRLALFNVTKRNHDLLSITRLVTILATYDSEQEAVASYSASISA